MPAALVDELDKLFTKRTSPSGRRFSIRENVWCAPVQTLEEVAADPMAEAAGVFVNVPSEDGPQRQVATPADFYGTPLEMRSWMPELGQNTEEVLLELGFDWEKIIALKEAGAIP